MKKKITIDEKTLEDLDFLICKHLKDGSVSNRKISSTRELWIKKWVEDKFKEWSDEQNKGRE